MYIRCKTCAACTRLALGHEKPEMRCHACGRGYRLDRLDELGPTPQDRYLRALDHAEEQKIDLASAYSVLLGFMTLETARELEDGGQSRTATRFDNDARADESASANVLSYDPGFAEAVSEGYLKIRQAVERGDRVAWSSKLAREHRLSMDLAFQVADNRISLEEARARSLAPEDGLAFRSSRVAAVVLLLVGLVSWGLGREITAVSDDRSATVEAMQVKRRVETPAVEASVSVQVNPQGQVTRITGRTPRSILDAFCGSDTSDPTCESLHVTPASGAWTGSYRDGKTVRAITIRRDEQTGRWVAGNGVDPVGEEPDS